jgi:phenylacetic acid degradation protein
MTCYAIDGLAPVVDPSAFVHPSAVLIGDVHVGPGCYVGPGASMRGDFGRLIMRAGGNLQDNCVVHGFPNTDTLLEEDAHIGHGAVLQGCTIRRNALVGMNAVVMDEAEIGESAFVAAMAFVPARFVLPARHLAAGLPARVVRELGPMEIEWKMQGTREYQDLTRRCHASLREVAPLAAAEPGRARLDLPVTRPLARVKSRG